MRCVSIGNLGNPLKIESSAFHPSSLIDKISELDLC
jgi:hypothetical protein